MLPFFLLFSKVILCSLLIAATSPLTRSCDVYDPPEVVRGEQRSLQTSHPRDVYSFGAMLLVILCGWNPSFGVLSCAVSPALFCCRLPICLTVAFAGEEEEEELLAWAEEGVLHGRPHPLLRQALEVLLAPPPLSLSFFSLPKVFSLLPSTWKEFTETASGVR